MHKKYVVWILCIFFMPLHIASAGPNLGDKYFSISDTNTIERDDVARVYYVVEKRILSVNDQEKFLPYRRMNRAEFIKAAMSALRGDLIPYASDCFPDVKKEWFAPYICTLSEKGLVQEDADGFFHPDKEITLNEAAQIIYGIVLEERSSNALEALANQRVIPTNFWSPTQPVRRIDAAKIFAALADQRFLPREYQDYRNLDNESGRSSTFEKAVNTHDLALLETVLAANIGIVSTHDLSSINENQSCCTIVDPMQQQASDFLKFLGKETFSFHEQNAASRDIYTIIRSVSAVSVQNSFFFPETPYEYIAGIGSEGGLLFYARNDLLNKKIMRVVYVSGIHIR